MAKSIMASEIMATFLSTFCVFRMCKNKGEWIEATPGGGGNIQPSG